MYTVHESSEIREKLPVGTILSKSSQSVCHDSLINSYRLRTGDFVAVPKNYGRYKVVEVINADVKNFGFDGFCVDLTGKAGKRGEQRFLQYGANLIRKLNLLPACDFAAAEAEACNRNRKR